MKVRELFSLYENLPRHVQKEWDTTRASRDEAVAWLLENNVEMLTRWLKVTGQAGINMNVGQEVWTSSKSLVVYEHTFLTELLPELLKSINIHSNFKEA